MANRAEREAATHVEARLERMSASRPPTRLPHSTPTEQCRTLLPTALPLPALHQRLPRLLPPTAPPALHRQ